MCKKLVKKWNKKIKKMKWQDIVLAKIAAAAFVLALAKMWSPILSLEWYWYGIIFIIAYAWLIKRIS